MQIRSFIVSLLLALTSKFTFPPSEIATHDLSDCDFLCLIHILSNINQACFPKPLRTRRVITFIRIPTFDMGRRLRKYGVPDLQNSPNVFLLGPLRMRNFVTQMPLTWHIFQRWLGKNDKKRDAKVRRMLELLNSSPGLPDDDQWIPKLVVGAGAFGVAGLFQKQNNHGNVIDVSHFSAYEGNH